MMATSTKIADERRDVAGHFPESRLTEALLIYDHDFCHVLHLKGGLD